MASKPTCSRCHDPHSADQPKLLRGTVHAALSGCDSCHAPPARPKPFAPRQDAGGKLCANCHDPAGLAAGGKVEHAPFKKGECVSCHDPHDSNAKKLTRAEGNALCIRCHKQHGREGHQVPTSRSTTGAGCAACHKPHASKEKALLDTDAAANCAGCHAKTEGAGQEEGGPQALRPGRLRRLPQSRTAPTSAG